MNEFHLPKSYFSSHSKSALLRHYYLLRPEFRIFTIAGFGNFCSKTIWVQKVVEMGTFIMKLIISTHFCEYVKMDFFLTWFHFIKSCFLNISCSAIRNSDRTYQIVSKKLRLSAFLWKSFLKNSNDILYIAKEDGHRILLEFWSEFF